VGNHDRTKGHQRNVIAGSFCCVEILGQYIYQTSEQGRKKGERKKGLKRGGQTGGERKEMD